MSIVYLNLSMAPISLRSKGNKFTPNRKVLLDLPLAPRQLGPHLLPPSPFFPLCSSHTFLEDPGHSPISDLSISGSFPRSPCSSFPLSLLFFPHTSLSQWDPPLLLFKMLMRSKQRCTLLPVPLLSFISVALITVSHTSCLIYICYWS